MTRASTEFMVRVLVSACLLGEKVRYNGNAATSSSPVLMKWLAERRIVPFCPELAGGLSVPRPPAEIQGAGGRATLNGTARVVTVHGVDVTESFLQGARLAVDRATTEGVGLAVLKDGSPSCGSGFIYDGSFSGVRIPQQGVTAALFEALGIRVFSEQQLDAAALYLDELEREPRS
jgi:uncharacterized protein YbbK (DUF523 family)